MHHWTWAYTLITLFVLLSSFLLAGAVLIRRHSQHARMRRTPHSISTPYGQIGYEDIRTQKMLAQGIERARRRQYSHPRGG
jgi:hypothetical protein